VALIIIADMDSIYSKVMKDNEVKHEVDGKTLQILKENEVKLPN